MTRNVFTLRPWLIALVLLASSCFYLSGYAQTIKIGTVSVSATQDNLDVLGDGKVSYQAQGQLLVLKGANITESIIVNGIKGLTIQTQGENTLETTKASLDLKNGSEVTLTGGHLSIKSGKNYAILVESNCRLVIQNISLKAVGSFASMGGSLGFMGETIEIDNANVTAQGSAYAIGDLASFAIRNASVTTPAGGAWNPANGRYCDSAGKVAKEVIIKADQQAVQSEPKIRFGTQKIDLTRSSDDLLGDGKVKYNHTDKQFTLNGYSTTSGITIEDAQGYSFVLVGNNYIETQKHAIVIDQKSDISITGEGDLTLVSRDTSAVSICRFSKLLIADTKVSMKGRIGISGTNAKAGEALAIDSAHVTIMAEDFALANLSSFTLQHARIAQPFEAYWNHEKHQLVGVDGVAVKHLVIETKSDNEGKNLGMLAIGSTYLDLNKSNPDVLGDGKVSYDAERHTLTLNGATITTEQNTLYMQEATDLVINVVGDCEIRSLKKSALMLFCDSHVTIMGTGRLAIYSPENCGIYLLYSNLLTIKNVEISIDGRWAIAGINGTSGEKVELINTQLSAKGWQSGISSLEKITLTQTVLVSPRDAVWNAKERCYMLGNERVKNLLFKRESEAIAVEEIANDASSDVKIRFVDHQAEVDGIPGSAVVIYTLEGQIAYQTTLGADGKCTIVLNQLENDRYIISVGRRSFKMIIG